MMNTQSNEKVIAHELRMVELLLHHVCKQDGVYKTIKTKFRIHTFYFLKLDSGMCLRIRINGMRIRNHELSYREQCAVSKNSFVHKIVLQGLSQNLQPYKVLVNKEIHFHLLLSVCS